MMTWNGMPLHLEVQTTALDFYCVEKRISQNYQNLLKSKKALESKLFFLEQIIMYIVFLMILLLMMRIFNYLKEIIPMLSYTFFCVIFLFFMYKVLPRLKCLAMAEE